MSRSKDRNTIEVIKVREMGGLPPYIELGQRHLEKEMPTIPRVPDGNGILRTTVTVPTDLMRLVLPDDQVDKIESMEFTYERKVTT